VQPVARGGEHQGWAGDMGWGHGQHSGQSPSGLLAASSQRQCTCMIGQSPGPVFELFAGMFWLIGSDMISVTKYNHVSGMKSQAKVQ